MCHMCAHDVVVLRSRSHHLIVWLMIIRRTWWTFLIYNSTLKHFTLGNLYYVVCVWFKGIYGFLTSGSSKTQNKKFTIMNKFGISDLLWICMPR